MARPFTENRLVIASHNPGKVSEVAALLASFPLDLVAAATLGLAEPEENGASFAENAGIKARAAARGARLPALADDSGLVVPALDGAPGIHSARWAGPGRDFRLAMERVHERLGAPLGLAPGSHAFLPSPGHRTRMAASTARPSRVTFGDAWSGRPEASAVSVTIPCSCPTATP